MEHTYARSRTLLVALGSILITVAAAGTAVADTINLAWDPNRESTVQGYMVHVGTQSGTYTQHLDVGLNTFYGWSNAVAGQRYCFAVSAYVAGHLEGPKSNEVCGFSNAVPILANPGSRSSAVGQPTSLQLQGSDPDGEAVSYMANGMPPGLSVMVGTGFISGTPTSAGTYSVTATVSDGVLQASQTFTWTITSATNVNVAPTLAAVSNQSTGMGQSVSLQLVGSDANSNPLTYSATGLPAGLSVAASTGVISGAPTTAGTYAVTASVSDGSLSATRTFTWTVVSAGVPTSPAPTPIAFLQGNYAVPQTPQSSVAVSFPGSQSAGSLNVVAIGWNDATSQVVSVTDARGNAYTQAVATVQAGIQSQAIYYAANIAAGATNSVTVRFNTAVSFPDVRIAEYRGISPLTPVEGARGASGIGSALNSGAVTTTAANVLLVGASYVQSVTTGAGSGYTRRMITTPNGSILEDRVVSAAGSYPATASTTGMGWVMQSVAFRGAGSSSGTDTAAPAVVITSPTSAATFTTTSSTLSLSGSASDNVGVTQVTWVNDRGGSGTASGTTNWSVNGIALASNVNTITVTARDAAGNTATDVISVTSNSVTPPTNTAPAVNAGADQTVTLPSAVALAGTASDDGQPSPSALTAAWSKVSGPGTVTFGNSAALNTSATFSAAGVYVLRLSASDGALTSSDDLTVTVNATTTSGAGLRGEYYSGTAFGSLLVTRVDPTVNFNWSSGTAGSGLPADNFSVRWTGDVIAPVTGTYTFTTVSDDGVRLWVNNQQVIDNWDDHAASTDTSAGITLQAGQRYPIRLEYYEAGGLSEIRLQWSYPGQATQAIPQSALSPTSSGTVPDPTPTPSELVAAYSFNASAGSTVADSSGNGNNGTASGTATWSAGKFGNAMRFNGTNSVVTVPDSASLDLTTAMTLEAWVKPAVAQGGWRSVMHKNVDRYYLMASSDNNSPVGGGTFGAGNQNTYAASALPVNVWTHLATTFDGRTVKLYINGIQVASMPQTTSITRSGGTLQIGADFYGEFFNGWIDEIRIYNRALSAAEIQSTMNAPVQ